jgi:hypothetical protein
MKPTSNPIIDQRSVAAMQVAPVAFARPLPPDFEAPWPEPPRGFIKIAGRGIRKFAHRAIDHGWLGVPRLRTHVVIAGFPRSGSTLLQLMIEACVSDARTFGTEMSAAWVQHHFTSRPLLITKAPWDVFHLDEIRALYATRRAKARFILTTRDPRAVLTSVHATIVGGPDGYFLKPAHWLTYYEHLHYAQQYDDVVTIEYEDIVCQPSKVQRRLTEFTGWHVHLPFEQYITAVPPDFATVNLNGLRPLDLTRLEAWRREEHRDRIRQILREIPELPEYLIEMGYESDTNWAKDYLDRDNQLKESGTETRSYR